MLMMVLCDREGRVYDVWITFGSVHEVRAFRERKKRSLWCRGLVENCVVYGEIIMVQLILFTLISLLMLGCGPKYTAKKRHSL